MFYKNKLLYFIVFLFILGCKMPMKKQGIKYYENFSGYQHPVKMIHEISEDQIKDKKSYYIANYDNGLLISVKKILNEKVFFEYKYNYIDDKLVSVQIIKENGTKNTKSFQKQRYD